MSNLIGNAVKYTDHGLVTVYVDKESDERQKISVVDTGRGIQPEEKARVFNKFHGVAEAGKGTGLGLYIAKAMVELHGGTIECKSEAGRGSTFTIRLPQRTGHETENTAA
ncbi:MAG: HAMP domain-containing histidine kinase [Elusimicrobia bacterium]|nr:HAMP domain-containing histidine kinase [Elusimicrobiota bacterium]